MKYSVSFFLILLEVSLLFISVSSLSRRNLKFKVVAPTLNNADYNNQSLLAEWAKYKTKHGKGYNSSEDQTRFSNWLENSKEVSESKAHWNVTLNKFSDLSFDEKNITYLNYKHKTNRHASPPLPLNHTSWVSKKTTMVKQNAGILPASVDWRAAGKVTPVKDQESCGACWAFATVAALESLNLIMNSSATNASSNFSEQQHINCDTWNNGCDGGDPGLTMNWAFFNGTVSEVVYPYTSNRGVFDEGAASCNGLSSKSSFQSFGANFVQELDTTALMSAVANQPVVVTVYADYWFSYGGGIFSNCTSVEGINDHVVLLVGYSNTTWIIKNSWGTDWGDGGFIYLDMTNPLCGAMISQEAVYPMAIKQTADLDPWCSYYGTSYCYDMDYFTYMFGKLPFFFFDFILFAFLLDNCFVTCGF